MPAYNAERFLAASIDSVLSQEGVSLELIVVDDGSTDGTPDVLSARGSEIRSVRIANSGGPSRPRNVGVAESRGKYIAFFDADDIMLPGKLATSVAALDEHEKAGLFCSDFRVVDEFGQPQVERWLASYRRFRNDLTPQNSADLGLISGRQAYRQLLRANFVGTSSVVTRRQALEDVGGFNESLKNADDIDMWLRLTSGGWDLLFQDTVFHEYRKVEGGVTARGGLRNEAIIRIMLDNLNVVDDAEDRDHIENRLKELWLGFGYSLRRTGRRDEAVAAYREALQYGLDPRSVLGWTRSRLGI